MINIYSDDVEEKIPKDCIISLGHIFKRVSEGKLNPYNIYGKCYNFDDYDLNDTVSITDRRRLSEVNYQPKGFTV